MLARLAPAVLLLRSFPAELLRSLGLPPSSRIQSTPAHPRPRSVCPPPPAYSSPRIFFLSLLPPSFHPGILSSELSASYPPSSPSRIYTMIVLLENNYLPYE